MMQDGHWYWFDPSGGQVSFLLAAELPGEPKVHLTNLIQAWIRGPHHAGECLANSTDVHLWRASCAYQRAAQGKLSGVHLLGEDLEDRNWASDGLEPGVHADGSAIGSPSGMPHSAGGMSCASCDSSFNLCLGKAEVRVELVAVLKGNCSQGVI